MTSLTDQNNRKLSLSGRIEIAGLLALLLEGSSEFVLLSGSSVGSYVTRKIWG